MSRSPPSILNFFNLRRRKTMATDTVSPVLQEFISKTMRITTTDTRVFVGELKCTDKDKNLILAQTHEYRYPTGNELRAGVESGEGVVEEGKVKLTLKSRYIGLIVVPGEFIVKIEVEEGEGTMGSARGSMMVSVDEGS
ncbi:hypothetical protein L873DRAFT_1817404 [Choiromyces venosus 120613-1]|uniref:Sm domain-containing protein n=1 Tax=Choiromyces venosus 120613-1 TaxID=1336337 RepID=A0A3N4J2Y5_9PEZI|nr:hypothetical protein L873DRAFT_1817404 [Choiromyces venosus 120613-1]